MNINLMDMTDVPFVRGFENTPISILARVHLPYIFKNIIYEITWLVTDKTLPYAILGRPGLDRFCIKWRSKLL